MNAYDKALLVAVSVLILFFQSSCMQYMSHEAYARRQRMEQEAQFDPYRQKNTIEAYREFMQRYPENMFVSTAKHLADSLEFAPYEKTDTIEGFMEFVLLYPGNQNVPRANARIEQMEFKRYENMDTIEGYREFLVKYQHNPYTLLAKERLQELEFRAFDARLQKKHGFDLLLYRLQSKRALQAVQVEGTWNASDCVFFASLDMSQMRQCFCTHLICACDFDDLRVPRKKFVSDIFTALYNKTLGMLDAAFGGNRGLYGFKFEISSSAHRFHGDRKVLAECIIPVQAAHLFVSGKLDQAQLLAASTLIINEKPTAGIANAEGAASDRQTALAMDGKTLMHRAQERQQCTDAIIARSWRRAKKNGSFDTVDTVEKWKSFGAPDGLVEKSVLRYMIGYGGTLSKKQAAAILTISFIDKPKEFWYIMYRGDAGRTPHIDSYRPTAEDDFPLADYKDIPTEREKHVLQGMEEFADKRCFVVASKPVSEELPYGSRMSWIDGQALMPIKIDYFDKKGARWKSARIAWQNRCGRWFWEQAVVENLQTGDVTTITTKDVRVNVGLPDSDFTPHALQRLTGR